MQAEQQKRKKVLHVIDSFGTGGAETWLLQVARYLQSHPETGLHIDFLATGGIPAVYDEAILQTGSKIFYSKYSIKNWASFRKDFKEILRREKYDAIHHHQDFISGWHFLLAMGSLPRVRITHLHNPYNFVRNYVIGPGRWISFKLGRLLSVLLTTKITGTSNAVMDEYGYDKWPFKNKRVFPAYCGFDVKRFQYNKNAKGVVCEELGWNREQVKIALFTGRIGLQDHDTAQNQKNPEFALQIAKALISKNENWKFLFVGYKGALGERMEAGVLAEGLEDKIKFLGLRNDVPTIMSASDVLVFPSFWEGLGMVAVEAQASGLPVVISDSIPREAIVISELSSIKSLALEAQQWVDAIYSTDSASFKRETYAAAIANSPFSIEQSVTNLIKLYADVK